MTQGQFCSSFISNIPDQEYLQKNFVPIVYTSGQETTIQHFSAQVGGGVCYNQYETPVGESISQGFVVSQPISIVPQTSIQVNQDALAYSLQGPACGYPGLNQGAEVECLQLTHQVAPSYQVTVQPTQGLQICGTTTQVQDNDFSEKQFNRENLCNNRILEEKLVQHEPCIRTLLKLEADLEVFKKQCAQQQHEVNNLKQSCERKDITICNLKHHLSQQECEINRLLMECKEEDISIEVLSSENAVDPFESKKFERPMVLYNNHGHQVELNHLSRKKGSGEMKQELTRLRLENRDVIRLQAKLCKLELKDGEHERLKVENMSQRQEIARLERRLQKFEVGTSNVSPSIDMTQNISSTS